MYSRQWFHSDRRFRTFAWRWWWFSTWHCGSCRVCTYWWCPLPTWSSLSSKNNYETIWIHSLYSSTGTINSILNLWYQTSILHLAIFFVLSLNSHSSIYCRAHQLQPILGSYFHLFQILTKIQWVGWASHDLAKSWAENCEIFPSEKDIHSKNRSKQILSKTSLLWNYWWKLWGSSQFYDSLLSILWLWSFAIIGTVKIWYDQQYKKKNRIKLKYQKQIMPIKKGTQEPFSRLFLCVNYKTIQTHFSS